MKFVINAKRDSKDETWFGYIGDEQVSACPLVVEDLFAGMSRALKARFEISNVRPRYVDYHTFVWKVSSPNNDMSNYEVTEVLGGYNPAITPHVSRYIRQAFYEKDEIADFIYVSIY